MSNLFQATVKVCIHLYWYMYININRKCVCIVIINHINQQYYIIMREMFLQSSLHPFSFSSCHLHLLHWILHSVRENISKTLTLPSQGWIACVSCNLKSHSVSLKTWALAGKLDVPVRMWWTGSTAVLGGSQTAWPAQRTQLTLDCIS